MFEACEDGKTLLPEYESKIPCLEANYACVQATEWL